MRPNKCTLFNFSSWSKQLGCEFPKDGASSRDPANTGLVKVTSVVQEYLKRFYNMKPSEGNVSVGRRPRSLPALKEKIREMQHFFGIRETGRLDQETLQMMKTPRCGVSDVDNYSTFPNKPKWRKNTITYMWDKLCWHCWSFVLKNRVVFVFFYTCVQLPCAGLQNTLQTWAEPTRTGRSSRPWRCGAMQLRWSSQRWTVDPPT